MKKILIQLFKFDIMQFRLGRKFIGGTFYHIYVSGLSIGPFWSDQLITSCQSKLLTTETYEGATEIHEHKTDEDGIIN